MKRGANLPYGHKVLGRVVQEGVGLCGALLQHALKLRACVCEAVVNVVGEGVQRAHGRLLLRWIPRCT